MTVGQSIVLVPGPRIETNYCYVLALGAGKAWRTRLCHNGGIPVVISRYQHDDRNDAAENRGEKRGEETTSRLRRLRLLHDSPPVVLPDSPIPAGISLMPHRKGVVLSFWRASVALKSR